MLKNVFKRPAYYVASAVFVIVSIVYLIAIIHQPYIGLELKNVNGNWRVISCDPNGDGYKLGIRAGDTILKINDVATGNYPNALIWSEAEGAKVIEIKKVNEPHDTVIKIPQRPLPLLSLGEIPMVILGLIFGLFGFLVWYKRPLLPQARSLFWLDWLIGLAIVIAPASSRDVLLARDLEYITLSSAPVLLVYFFSIYPVNNKNRINRYSRYVLTLICIIILGLTVLQSSGIIHYNSPLKKLVLINLSMGILVILRNLGALSKLPGSKPEKNQAGILLGGLLVGFGPFLLFTAIPSVFSIRPLLYTEISYLFVAAIPVSWYYVIVNQYLPDSRRILGRFISFFLAGIIISLTGICLLLCAGVFKYLDFEVLQALFSIIIMVVVGFDLFRLMIHKLLNKFGFLTGKQELNQRVLKINERLTSLHGGEQLLDEVAKSLGIEGAFIVAEDAKGKYLKSAAGRFKGKPDEQSRLESYFKADHRINSEVQTLPDDFPAGFYIFFEYNDFNCGIFLGHRSSRTKLLQADLPLITLISSQVAQRIITTFILNELSLEIKEIAQKSLTYQRKIQRMQGLTGSLFKSIEQERKSIAREIHDGSLQLTLDLNRWLDEIAEECPSTEGGKAFQAIAHQREIIRNLDFELRSICSDLRPPSLSDLGLYFAIESLCEETIQNETIQISLEMIGINEETNLDEEIQTAAYRFVQEGIANAIKHSETKKIQITIELAQTKLDLIIRDFGKGFELKKAEDLPLASEHFGLIGMKERLTCLDGELFINSVISQGTILRATIPIKGRRINRATGKWEN